MTTRTNPARMAPAPAVVACARWCRGRQSEGASQAVFYELESEVLDAVAWAVAGVAHL